MRCTWLLLTIGWLGMTLSPVVVAEVAPQHVAIIANRKNADSLAVAKYYAAKRGIPEAHIVALSLDPKDENISRQAYDKDIVQVIRKTLIERNLAAHVRVLVPVYGIPLRVHTPIPSAEEKRWAAEALEAQTRALQALETLATALQPEGETPPAASAQVVTPAEQVRALATRIEAGMQGIRTRVKATQDPAKQAAEIEQLMRAIVRFGGMTALLPQLQPHTAANAQAVEAERQKIQQRISSAQAIAQVLREVPSDSNRQRVYRLVEFTHGVLGVFRHSEWELDTLLHKDGEASVDSELSLLWWDQHLYPAAKYVPNPLYHTMQNRPNQASHGVPILMVSRLDAPTPKLAKQLVERAIAAEQQGLNGQVYVDARGMQMPSTGGGGYAFYDQALRQMAELFSRVTAYKVVLENTEERFSQPGAAPQVAVYAGWYRLRHYEDAFTFNTGAIGYHLASAEAVSIHDPNEPGWCKNALERGITVTLGSVNEPYLEAFPLPNEFFGLLFTGRYSLVEAYYLTIRYLSWRLILFGDPLYNPWKGRDIDPGEALVLQGRQAAATALPTAPSQLPFADPRMAMQQLQQRRTEVLANVNRLMDEWERQVYGEDKKGKEAEPRK